MGLAALVSNLPGRGDVVRREECGLAVEPGADGHLRGVRRLLAEPLRDSRRWALAAAAPSSAATAGRPSRAISWSFYGSLCAGLV